MPSDSTDGRYSLWVRGIEGEAPGVVPGSEGEVSGVVPGSPGEAVAGEVVFEDEHALTFEATHVIVLIETNKPVYKQEQQGMSTSNV